ncbi:hypothetical protein MTR_4g068447 [Medicago truncatula]|uniref:Uncharacterized protein n=1 Tax=Medicago truncatula TaxID=3880 RepID=A0A072UKX0_MEDTR|nr:hypothetical protein MTR_4g068447 [Medicago truncatula]
MDELKTQLNKYFAYLGENHTTSYVFVQVPCVDMGADKDEDCTGPKASQVISIGLGRTMERKRNSKHLKKTASEAKVLLKLKCIWSDDVIRSRRLSEARFSSEAKSSPEATFNP